MVASRAASLCTLCQLWSLLCEHACQGHWQRYRGHRHHVMGGCGQKQRAHEHYTSSTNYSRYLLIVSRATSGVFLAVAKLVFAFSMNFCKPL